MKNIEVVYANKKRSSKKNAHKKEHTKKGLLAAISSVMIPGGTVHQLRRVFRCTSWNPYHISEEIKYVIFPSQYHTCPRNLYLIRPDPTQELIWEWFLINDVNFFQLLAIRPNNSTKNVSDVKITIAGYKLYRKDQQNNHRGGGVLVYRAESLFALKREDLERPGLEPYLGGTSSASLKMDFVRYFFYLSLDGSDFLYAEFMSFEDVLEIAHAEQKEVTYCTFQGRIITIV